MSERKQAIQSFTKSSVELARLLKAEGTLSIDEQIAIENHLLIVQLAMTITKYGPKNQQNFLRNAA